jgi:HAD superfamily phosphatase (TIGR01668 family)
MIICDLDNTLSPHFTRLPTRGVIEFCQNVRNAGIKLTIASNNHKKRVLAYTNKLATDEVMPNAHKPLKHRIMKMLKKFNLHPSEVIFIGDQFITDI